MIDRVVWDFGGVLFRWDPSALLARTLPHRMTIERDAQYWKQAFFLSYRGEWAEFDRGTITVDVMVPRIAARLGLSVAEAQGVVDAVPDELAPISSSVDLLAQLKGRGLRLNFLSNMPAPLADHLNGKHGFLHQFDSGIYSSHVRLTKPDPAIFAVAQQRFGGNPATTLFIDDHPENIDAARRHGWQTHHCVDPDGLSAALRERRLIE